MIAKGKSISHGTAALEYDLAKEINGEAAATEIHRHELFESLPSFAQSASVVVQTLECPFPP